MQRISWLAAAAATALIAHAPAHAVATANASIAHLTITLTDLDVNDGVTPLITFAGFSYSYAYNATLPSLVISQGTSAFDATSAAASSVNGSVSTSTTITSLSASAIAAGANGLPGSFSQSYGFGQWNSFSSNWFTLSANTQVTFTADTHVDANVTTAFDGSSNYEQALGATSVYLQDATGTVVLRDDQLALVANTSNYDSLRGIWLPVAPQGFNGSLSLSYSNTAGDSATGIFYGYVQSDAYGQAPLAAAVPEPETYALMLAGLGTLGFMARRRQRG